MTREQLLDHNESLVQKYIELAANALALAFDEGLYGDLIEPEDDDDTDEWEAEEEEHGEPVGSIS